ncbi:hypothetical protein SAMN02910456_01045 [Ruminococcaceae bacterium YRB3002]|nr:hypothetical protein SAMN02910456_01045 [Ruminococcaceae bacterium YRB3002]
MKTVNSTARTKFNRRAMAISLVLTVIFLALFVFGVYCIITTTVPTPGPVSAKFMTAFIGYCANRGLVYAAMCLAIFIFCFRVHNIDDFVTQSGSYEIRWLGFVFIGIWVINLVLRFFIPGMLFPPYGLLFLGVICVLLFKLDNMLANKVDMYMNSEGTHRRLGDMGPVQFLDFVAHLFKQRNS